MTTNQSLPLISFNGEVSEVPTLTMDFQNGYILQTKDYTLSYNSKTNLVQIKVKEHQYNYSYTELMKAKYGNANKD